MRRESPGALKATWFRYVAVCISLSACLLLLQHLLQPAIDGQIWGMLLHNAHGDGPEIQRVHLDARWTTGRLSYPSGIFRNRLVLAQRSVVRSREPIHFGNKEWELRLRADGMDRVGPYRHDKGLTESVFALVLAPPGTDSIALQIDIAAPASGSVRRMIEREWIAAEALASSVGTGEADAGESTSSPVELTLRHSEGNLQVSIDGRLIGSVQLTYRFESAFLELRALPGSLVAFDDLAIGVVDRDGEIRPSFGDSFDARPVQGWPIGVELAEGGGWYALTLGMVLLLLAFDLAVTLRVGRSMPTDTLLILMLPEALLSLSIQSVLHLPFVPVLSAIMIVWLSKTVLALSISRGSYNVVVPILLCALQTLHWLWFRPLWGFVGIESVAIAAAIPMASIMGSLPARRGAGALLKLASVLMVLGATELLLRSLPIERMLDAEWRNRNRFWDLEHHSSIFEVPEGEFEDGSDLLFSVQKPSGRFRIACLGSSSTFGIGATQQLRENYPVLLEHRLRSCCGSEIDVINAGLFGYHFTQLRVYYEDVLSHLDPDLIIVYFGHNGDRPNDLDYYEKVEALIARRPGLGYPTEVHAALGLRTTQPWLVDGYLSASRFRLLVGLSVIAEAIEDPRKSEQRRVEGATSSARAGQAESVQILADAVVSSGAELMLIPEITSIGADHPYEIVFAEVATSSDKVSVYNPTGIDRDRDLVDKCHMNSSGYRRLALSIADHLIDAGIVVCESDS